MCHPLMRLLAIGLLLGSTGCSTLFPRNISPPEAVFTDKELPAPAQASASAPVAPNMVHGMEQDLVQAYAELRVADAAAEADLAEAFLYKGISVVDARCDRYFSDLGKAAQKIAYGQRGLGLTTSLVAALQGLTGVAAKEIALTGAGLGYLSSLSSAYGDVFIFSPQVSSVQSLVAATQAQVKERIAELGATGFSRGLAIGLLQEYEKTCEVHMIRRLVNESLSSAQPVASFGSEEAAGRAVLSSTRLALGKALKTGTLTDDQLLAVYWLVTKPAAADAASQALQFKLLGKVPELLNAAETAVDPAKLSALKPVLMALLAPLQESPSARMRLDTLLATKRQNDAIANAPAAPGLAAAPAAAKAQPVPRGFAPSLRVGVPGTPR